MKIAVLDLTSHPESLLSGKPRVHEQLTGWLAPALPQAGFVVCDIADGGQSLPKVEDFDGLLVSGSEAGVYDETPWMRPLRKLLLQTRDAGKPVYGICFGHQIMADTFGGKAEKAEIGNQIGARRFISSDGSEYDAHVWHQDQVTKVPPGAEITAYAGYCPVAELKYDFPAQSVQFHPEYTQHHLRELFDILKGIVITDEEHERALGSFDNSCVAIDLKAQEAADFFRLHSD